MTLIGKTALVIGGGIGGLATARALASRGMQVTVLEQAPQISEVGAGIQISPNGFAVLDALGLGDKVRNQTVQAQKVVLRDYRKGHVVTLDLSHVRSPNYYFLHRADLIDILAAGATELGVTIRLSQAVNAYQSDHRNQIKTEDGTMFQADIIVAADGLHSKLRSLLNPDTQAFFTGQTAWRAIVPNHSARGPQAWLHMAPGRHLVSYPIREGKFLNLVAIQERVTWVEEGWAKEDNPENLRAAFADAGQEVQDLLKDVHATHLWGLFRHPVAQHWHNDKMALLGDAAHPTLPFLAQGASLALEDAWALADELASHDSAEAGLAAYQARRLPRVTKVIDAANKNAWKYHLRFPLTRFAAHKTLQIAGKLAPKAMVNQFSWLYDHDETRL